MESLEKDNQICPCKSGGSRMLLDLNRPQIKSESLFIPPWTWNILDNSSQELNLKLKE